MICDNVTINTSQLYLFNNLRIRVYEHVYIFTSYANYFIIILLNVYPILYVRCFVLSVSGTIILNVL